MEIGAPGRTAFERFTPNAGRAQFSRSAAQTSIREARRAGTYDANSVTASIVSGTSTSTHGSSAREGDDTGITRLTESVKKSEERFRMLAEGVPNHLLFPDPRLRIVFAKDVFLEAAGQSADKAMVCTSPR